MARNTLSVVRGLEVVDNMMPLGLTPSFGRDSQDDGNIFGFHRLQRVSTVALYCTVLYCTVLAADISQDCQLGVREM